jgi:hypothetical protein
VVSCVQRLVPAWHPHALVSRCERLTYLGRLRRHGSSSLVFKLCLLVCGACSPCSASAPGAIVGADGPRSPCIGFKAMRASPHSLHWLVLHCLWFMLQDGGAPAVLAAAPLSIMLADARAIAVLAAAPLSVMLTMLADGPQQYLHGLLRQLCWQIPEPPKSLHLLLSRLQFLYTLSACSLSSASSPLP